MTDDNNNDDCPCIRVLKYPQKSHLARCWDDKVWKTYTEKKMKRRMMACICFDLNHCYRPPTIPAKPDSCFCLTHLISYFLIIFFSNTVSMHFCTCESLEILSTHWDPGANECLEEFTLIVILVWNITPSPHPPKKVAWTYRYWFQTLSHDPKGKHSVTRNFKSLTCQNTGHVLDLLVIAHRLDDGL